MRRIFTYLKVALIALTLSQNIQGSPTQLDSLPRDVLHNIQEYLDLDDYKAMRSVSRNLYDRLGFFEHKNIMIQLNNSNLVQVAQKINYNFIGQIKGDLESFVIFKKMKMSIPIKNISITICDGAKYPSTIQDIFSKLESLYIKENGPLSTKKTAYKGKEGIQNIIENVNFQDIKNFSLTLNKPPTGVLGSLFIDSFYPSLSYLSLNGFTLSDKDMESILYNISDCYLESEKISEFTNLKFSNLLILNLSNNRLNDKNIAYTDSIGTLSELYLDNNLITGLGLIKILFSKNKPLRKLSIENNLIKDLDVDLQKKGNKDIISLKIANNPITEDSAQLLFNLSFFKYIISLSIGSAKDLTLLHDIKYPPSLKELNILHKKPSGLRVKNLTKSILENLTKLDLSNTKLKFFLEDLKLYRTSIKYLTLSNCDLETHHAAKIINSDYSDKLYFLDLTRNKLGNAGAEHLVNSMKFTNLYTLDLSNNNIESFKNLLKKNLLFKVVITEKELGFSPSENKTTANHFINNMKKNESCCCIF